MTRQNFTANKKPAQRNAGYTRFAQKQNLSFQLYIPHRDFKTMPTIKRIVAPMCF